MNSHIVEKTMHSIKNIDRLTDLAAIDVYNTTHDTINKYEIMKEHATEEYTNESFYQESVLAGVLIGAGVLGVAISAFFIIKKIIDTKAAGDSSVKSSDGKPVAANVDLRDPKSAEKYKSAVAARIGSLSDSTQIKISKKVNTEAFNAVSKQIGDIITSLESIVDNKSDADEISKIINGMKLEAIDLGKVVETVNETATKANFVEAIGLDNMISLAKLVKDLEDKINGVEKTVNQKGANKKDGENTIEVPADVMNKLKNDTNVNKNIIDALLTSARSFMETTDASVVGAAKIETEAKNKDEEAKPAEKPADTGAAENKTETATGENKTDEKSAADTGSEAGGNNNTGTQSSTSENVIGPGGQTEAVKQASEAKEAAEAQNKNVLYLNPKGNAQDATGKPVIPAAAEAKANEKTLEDVINMLKSGKSEEEIRGQLAPNNYNTEQIDAFLTEAKNKITNERKSELLNQTLGGTKPKVLEGEVLPPDTEAKPFKFPKAEDNTFNNNRQEQGIDKVVENIRRLVPADSKEGSWDKIVPTLKTYGFTDKEINDYAVRNNIIPSESQDTPAPTPTETAEPKTENPSTPVDQNAGENAQNTTPEQSSENQQQTQPQQNVNQNPNGINIKDMDNIIRQASYDGISKDISESICKNVIDDISSNTEFNVANRVKDEAVKLKADQKLYFTDAAKRILRVYANAIADIEPQTDAVKKYAEDVKQASEMDLSLIEPPVISRGSLEPPKEYVNKVAALIKQIPGAIPNKAKELAESEYGDREKNDMANDIAKQLDEPEATNFRNAYASIINGSATGNIDENQLSSFGDAAAAVNTNNSANQQDQSNNSQNSVTSPQESINAINEDIMRAVENVQLSDTAKQDLFKISGENIINSIVQSIEQLGGKQAQPEQVCSMVNGTLCNRVYKLIHDAIMQDRKFLQRPVFNTMSKYGEAVTTLCSQVRDICAKMLVSYYNIPVNMVDQIIIPFESYRNDKKSVMYKWFREYDIDVIRDKKIQMIMESQQQEEQKSE